MTFITTLHSVNSGKNFSCPLTYFKYCDSIFIEITSLQELFDQYPTCFLNLNLVVVTKNTDKVSFIWLTSPANKIRCWNFTLHLRTNDNVIYLFSYCIPDNDSWIGNFKESCIRMQFLLSLNAVKTALSDIIPPVG